MGLKQHTQDTIPTTNILKSAFFQQEWNVFRLLRQQYILIWYVVMYLQLLTALVVTSVTRLGNFRKILATNFLTKVAQLLGDFKDYFEKGSF